MNIIFGLGWHEFLILVIIGGVFLVPVVALINIVSSEFKGYDKLMWILIVLFLPFAGALIYFFVGRKQKITLSDSDELDTLL